MNFAAFPFCEHATPRGFTAWYVVLLALLAFAISPSRRTEQPHAARTSVVQPCCSGDVRALAMRVAVTCTRVATAPQGAARDGQPFSFHAAARYQEINSVAHLSHAPRNAPGVIFTSPHSGALGSDDAGARRGTGAGPTSAVPVSSAVLGVRSAARGTCHGLPRCLAGAVDQEANRV